MALPICVMAGIVALVHLADRSGGQRLDAIRRLAERGIDRRGGAELLVIAIIVALLGTGGASGLAATWRKWSGRNFGLIAVSILPSMIQAGALGTALLICFPF